MGTGFGPLCDEPEIQQANAARQTGNNKNVILLLMQQMKSMQDMMNMMQNNMNNMCTNANNTNNFNRQNKGGCEECKYCWTHGWCFHDGRECTHKAQGHKDNATFKNHMNGSNKNCKKGNNGK